MGQSGARTTGGFNRKARTLRFLALALVLLALALVLPATVMASDDGKADPLSLPFITLVCSASGDQRQPDVSGSTIVWVDNRGTFSAIYGLDRASGSEFFIGRAAQYGAYNSGGSSVFVNSGGPQVDGRTVVWVAGDYGNWDILGYDLDTMTPFTVCDAPGDQEWPSVSGDTIVWQDYRNGYSVIYAYDVSTREERPISSLTWYASNPRVSGDLVVWAQQETFDQADVFGYRLDTNESFLISSVAALGTWPSISGDTVVWRSNSGIFGYDLAEGREFTIATNTISYFRAPSVAGDMVAWQQQDNTGHNWLYGYDLSARRKFLITELSANFCTGETAVDSGVAVWSGFNATDVDVYMAALDAASSSQPPTVTSFAPTSGPVGTALTITGTNFTDVSSVAFHGATAVFNVDSATQITATVPAGATSGTISVTTRGGSATSATSFTVTVPPTVPKLTLKLSGLTSGAMRLGRRVTATGKVTPTSLAGSKVKLTVQKRGARWVTLKSVARTISATGAYSWKYKPAKRGAYRMKAAIAKTAAHTAAKTKWRTFRVK